MWVGRERTRKGVGRKGADKKGCGSEGRGQERVWVGREGNLKNKYNNVPECLDLARRHE